MREPEALEQLLACGAERRGQKRGRVERGGPAARRLGEQLHVHGPRLARRAVEESRALRERNRRRARGEKGVEQRGRLLAHELLECEQTPGRPSASRRLSAPAPAGAPPLSRAASSGSSAGRRVVEQRVNQYGTMAGGSNGAAGRRRSGELRPCDRERRAPARARRRGDDKRARAGESVRQHTRDFHLALDEERRALVRQRAVRFRLCLEQRVVGACERRQLGREPRVQECLGPAR